MMATHNLYVFNFQDNSIYTVILPVSSPKPTANGMLAWARDGQSNKVASAAFIRNPDGFVMTTHSFLSEYGAHDLRMKILKKAKVDGLDVTNSIKRCETSLQKHKMALTTEN
ncbi:hypothetical protein Q9X95_004693 [Vibrio parahaemolyticus]|uniref:hypothetical protein n=2 Tax=Vibrionaceae TaxID=641 RepID=UPI00240993EE|nr:hypothetical protein [Vibrio coralliilyticus]ELA7281065.1 hypothetical protein [Vibrio parahaemolyticus]WFB46962.1 hypothetical protein P6988_12655 [Vibrio coralliilyticus]